MDGPEVVAKAHELLGKNVIVELVRDSHDPSTIAQGRLLAFDEWGEIVIEDRMGGVHYAWPMLTIKEDTSSG